jgi:hypothetical protein
LLGLCSLRALRAKDAAHAVTTPISIPLACLLAVASAQSGGIATLSVEGARDVTSEGRAFLEVTTARSTYFVHEPIRVEIRFGFERAFYETEMVQLFRQSLDVPVQLQAPWLRESGGAIVAREGASLSFALDESIAQAERNADRVIGERTFTVLAIEWTIVPERPGPLALSGALLRFAYATHFTEDVFGGRVPVDRVDAFVRGGDLALTVEPLPEAGQPPEFTGAVGRFSIDASAKPRTLAVGESLELVLHIRGESEIGAFNAPRLDGLAGFHVRGKIEETRGSVRTIRYDLAPTSARVSEIPPIAFAYFDTQPPASYRTVRTEPIPLVVRGADSDGATPRAPENRRDEGVAFPSGLALVVLVALIAAVGVVLGVRTLQRARMRRRAARDPVRVRTRHAIVEFRERLAANGDVADAMADYLAARLGVTRAAVISKDLATRIAERGIPHEIATRAAQLLEALVAARFGGVAPRNAAGDARDVVEELERSFEAANERG